MGKKKMVNLNDCKDVDYLLSIIDHDMAINSDSAGDSEADDEMPLGSFNFKRDSFSELEETAEMKISDENVTRAS